MPQIKTRLSSRYATLVRNIRTVTYWTGDHWLTVKEADALMEDRSVEVYLDPDRNQWVAKHI